MDYMFEAGFLGTRAPLFMDFVTIIVAFLPLLVFVAITLAKIKQYQAHKISQSFLFVFSSIVVSYFEYGVRRGGGFNGFMEGSTVGHNYALIVLILHIIIACITMFLWVITIIAAIKKKPHKKLGIKTFMGITLTSISGIWVYLLLFVY